jgi:hypothetical protein
MSRCILDFRGMLDALKARSPRETLGPRLGKEVLGCSTAGRRELRLGLAALLVLARGCAPLDSRRGTGAGTAWAWRGWGPGTGVSDSPRARRQGSLRNPPPIAEGARGPRRTGGSAIGPHGARRRLLASSPPRPIEGPAGGPKNRQASGPPRAGQDPAPSGPWADAGPERRNEARGKKGNK